MKFFDLKRWHRDDHDRRQAQRKIEELEERVKIVETELRAIENYVDRQPDLRRLQEG